MSERKLAFLKDNLRGPIIPEIIDPKDFVVEDILKSYFREILWLAGRYARPTVEYEDLVDEGVMGLLDAIERFDLGKAKGNKKAFHNLAIVRIKSFMFEYFLNNNSQYTIPNYMARAMNLLDQLRSLLLNQAFYTDTAAVVLNFEVPEFEEAAPKKLREKVQGIKEKIESLASSSEKSYEEMVQVVLQVERDIGNYEAEEGTFEISPEEVAEQREFLEKFLTGLNPRAREVITLRLEGRTLEDVGKELGVTRERTRQIEEATLNFFRRTRMFQDATLE